MTDVNSGSEDFEILRMTENLCLRLGIDTHPLSVNWANMGVVDGSRQRIPYDVPTFAGDSVVLAKGLRGKLSAEEWEPLIASSLLYKKLARERNRKLVKLAPLIIPPFVGFFLVTYLLPYSWSRWVVILAWLPLSVAWILYALYTGNLIYRSYRTQADRDTATLLGREQIVKTLRKICEIQYGFVDYYRRGNWLTRSTPRPNIIDRIRLLSD